jgi:hypothetical protein
MIKTKNQLSRALTRRILACSVVALSAAIPGRAHAFTYLFDDGIQIRFDNNVEYSNAWRTAPVSKKLTSPVNNINTDDGDLALSHGLVSNRFQDVTSLDISDNGYGFDVSDEAFYDSVYEQHSQNTSQATYNAIGSSRNFPATTSALIGRNIELRNLYGYGSFNVAGIPVTVRVGRHALIWGESLFFPDNGIAYGMVPFDGVEATNEPNAEVKDILLPVGMASMSAQLTDSVRLEAYYQFEFEKTIIPPVGSYYSSFDFFDGGGQRIILAPPQLPYFPGNYFFRGPDIKHSSSGNFGLALHYEPANSPYDFGLYALQYTDRAPEIYVYPVFGPPTPTANGLSQGQYRLVYPEHIQIFGASASDTIGPLNIAGEVSARLNAPLTNTGVTVFPGQQPGAGSNALFPKGKIAYAQISAIYLGPATRFWDASTLVGELAGSQLLSVDKNGQNFVASNGGGPGYWGAAGFHFVFIPTYFEVRPGIDVSVPVGLAYNFWGQSPGSHTFNGSDQNHGGEATFGVTLTYLSTWNANLAYNQFFGPVSYSSVSGNSSGQLLADRSNVTFSLQHTF